MSDTSPPGPQAIDVADTVTIALKEIHSDVKPAVMMAGLTAAMFLVGKKMNLSPAGVALAMGICSKTADAALAELNEAGVSL